MNLCRGLKQSLDLVLYLITAVVDASLGGDMVRVQEGYAFVACRISIIGSSIGQLCQSAEAQVFRKKPDGLWMDREPQEHGDKLNGLFCIVADLLFTDYQCAWLRGLGLAVSNLVLQEFFWKAQFGVFLIEWRSSTIQHSPVRVTAVAHASIRQYCFVLLGP